MRAPEAIATASGEGEAWWWFGTLAEIKTTATETGGLLTLVEVTCGPGYAAPPHVHHREDEAFWVLDGRVRFVVGEKSMDAGAGDYLMGPRDVPHRFEVGDQGCRLLFILTPGGLENLIRATSEPARRRELPPPAEQPPDLEQLKATVAQFGCELLV